MWACKSGSRDQYVCERPDMAAGLFDLEEGSWSVLRNWLMLIAAQSCDKNDQLRRSCRKLARPGPIGGRITHSQALRPRDWPPGSEGGARVWLDVVTLGLCCATNRSQHLQPLLQVASIVKNNSPCNGAQGREEARQEGGQVHQQRRLQEAQAGQG